MPGLDQQGADPVDAADDTEPGPGAVREAGRLGGTAAHGCSWWQPQMHFAPHFLQDAGRFAPLSPVIDWQ